MASFTDRLRRAVYNTFTAPPDEEFATPYGSYGAVTSIRPDRPAPRFGTNDRSIVSSIYTRIAVDASSVEIKHARLDEKGRYISDMPSALNECLTIEANMDQAARSFRQNAIFDLCNKGVIAIVPVDTSVDPRQSASYDIHTMRVGDVIGWYPKHVKVNVYNENSGKREEIILPKRIVAIVENPLFAVINEPNSTLQRLIHKLSLLDSVDEAASSGKLDLIIQLPYVIKSETRKLQAEQRRNDIEVQLKGSKYGIAYTDGTEKITQLNRPVENNLLTQIQGLKADVYAQLGISEAVMNGSASESEMLNYWNRTIEPLMDAIVEAMKAKFLTKTARSQMQTIEYFRDPFRLVPVANLAEIADKFTRNEILSSNEIRQIIGWAPSDDPKADKLINSNMPQADQNPLVVSGEVVEPSNGGSSD